MRFAARMGVDAWYKSHLGRWIDRARLRIKQIKRRSRHDA